MLPGLIVSIAAFLPPLGVIVIFLYNFAWARRSPARLPFVALSASTIAWLVIDCTLTYRNGFKSGDPDLLVTPIVYGLGGLSFVFGQRWVGIRFRMLRSAFLLSFGFSLLLIYGCTLAGTITGVACLWRPTLGLIGLGAGFCVAANPIIYMKRIMGRALLYFGSTVLVAALAAWMARTAGYVISTYFVYLGAICVLTFVGILHVVYLKVPLTFLFYRNVHRNLRTLSRYIQELQGMEDVGESQESLLEIILQNMFRVLAFERSFLVTADRARNPCIRHFGPPSPRLRTEQIRDRVPFLRVKLPRAFADEIDRIFLLEEGFDPPFAGALAAGSPIARRYGRIIQRLRENIKGFQAEGYCVFIPLIFQSEVWGIIFLGPKSDGLPYFSGEITMLENARPAFAMALRNNAVIDELKAISARGTWDPARRVAASGLQPHTAQKIRLGSGSLIFASDDFASIVEKARQIAVLDLPTLIQGETGTGKELFARLLHHEGTGEEKPYVAVNCAAIPVALWESQVFGHARGSFSGATGDHAGFIEQAGDGVLFFDEIGEMPMDIQPKILRLIQERTYQPIGARKPLRAACRLVFATHRDLKAMVGAGQFREDLYYRISVNRIQLPPLRERRKEIPALVEHLLDRYAAALHLERKDFAEDALENLLAYAWPGNIRELENCVIRSLAEAKGTVIQKSDLPAEFQAPRGRTSGRGRARSMFPHEPASLDFEGLMRDYARELVSYTLKASKGNRSRAAAMLRITRGKLLYKMNELGLR